MEAFQKCRSGDYGHTLHMHTAVLPGFLIAPESSTAVLASIRSFIDNEFGLYYLIMGLGVFFISIYIAFSRYGDIRLRRKGRKAQVQRFTWEP